jgi:hypothetical protein
VAGEPDWEMYQTKNAISILSNLEAVDLCTYFCPAMYRVLNAIGVTLSLPGTALPVSALLRCVVGNLYKNFITALHQPHYTAQQQNTVDCSCL